MPRHKRPHTTHQEGALTESRKHSRGHHRPGKAAAARQQKEDDEERRLTALLFGGSQPVPQQPEQQQYSTRKKISHKDEAALEFEIDRTGVADVGAQVEQTDDSAEDDDDDDEQFHSESDNDADEVEYRPAWVDEDDEQLEVNLFQTDRLRKLRTSREEAGADALDGVDFAQRLRQRYQSTMQRTARTDWAQVNLEDHQENKRSTVDNDDDSATGESLLRESSMRRLPPNLLNVVRCPDANQSDPNDAVVQSVHFHPSSEPERPLMLTAGFDKTLRFFQVGAEESVKVHGIHFPKMPIYSAQFVGNSGNVVVSGRRPFFYIYDAIAGKLDYIPRILGRAEKSWETSVASPDGRTVAFGGNDGYVVLFDVISKRTRGELKLNGSVRAIAFSPDGDHILASGSDGDVYRWDVRNRNCLERFANEDGTITSSLAISSDKLAVGAESGVVNLFPGREGVAKKPLKSIMNLATSNDALCFNSDGQILAFSSRREKDSFKLLHVPTATVFSNWPTSKTPLGYVWSMDFSPESKFLAIGNDKGKCLLYSLEHYAGAD